jgi:hypothetical protein
MSTQDFAYTTALQDFRRARDRAALQEIVGRLTGRSTALLSYEDVYRSLGATGRSDRGIQEIPVAAVVGSVGRYADFNREFLPRRDDDRQRWARVLQLASENGLDAMPPIEVYRIGDVYFVQDGNHRVPSPCGGNPDPRAL